MLLSLRKNGLTSLFKEVRVFKGPSQTSFGGLRKWDASGLCPLSSKENDRA